MNESISNYISKMNLKSPASDEQLKITQEKMNFVFPSEYVLFIKETNGAYGTIGENFLQLWSLENIIAYNEGYCVKEYVPGLIFIGSDGGNEAYAFDSRNESNPIVQVPFIVMNFDDIIAYADNFLDFLKYLYSNKKI